MDTNSTSDIMAAEGETKKLPQGLNVLTILTFIGCGIAALFTLIMPFLNKFLLGVMDKAATSDRELSAKELADIQKGKAAIELFNQHMIPLMIVGIIGIVLCLVGALWMRKLKKDGYWLYVAGEISPIIASYFIMGSAQYDGVTSVVFGIIVPIVFVVLYTLQRKHLRY